MDDTTKAPKRISEIVVLVIVLVCAALILTDLTINLVNEIRTSQDQAVLNTPVPLQTIPTLPPGVKPTPFTIPG